MKAVIPVAGVGSKLRPHTHTQPKPLIPVAGKPILGHIIDSLIEAGVNEQVFIIGYLGEKIKDYVVSSYGDKIKASFVIQEPRRGLAHALWTAKAEIASTDEIIVVLGDTIFGQAIAEILKLPGAVLGVQEVDDPRRFGVAVADQQGHVTSLVEKPVMPVSNLALVGLYKITHVPVLLEVLDQMISQEIGPEDEYLLTDALMEMISREVQFNSYPVLNWFDCGQKKTLLHTNRILLEQKADSLPEYEFENTVIIPPVYISTGCKIEHSIIGPYVAIAENAHICNSIVKDSILGAYSSLDSIILSNSVIGNDTSLKGRSHSINIGDNTEIDFDQ